LKNELIQLEADLQVNPQMGTSLGNNTYKIRVAIKSKSKGKSGGARVITHLELDLLVEQQTTNIFCSLFTTSQLPKTLQIRK
jgi:hypothetical protein